MCFLLIFEGKKIPREKKRFLIKSANKKKKKKKKKKNFFFCHRDLIQNKQIKNLIKKFYLNK
jgi:hypothetical protein